MVYSYEYLTKFSVSTFFHRIKIVSPQDEFRKMSSVLHIKDEFRSNTKRYGVQLTPSIPPSEKKHKIIVQNGLYGALWIRVRGDPKAFQSVLENVLETDRTIYVAIKQSVLAESCHSCLESILEKNFKFYHYHTETDELIWYLWQRKDHDDLVPTYATSIEGGGVMVLSPDEKKVMLVYEYGRYGRCGGAVNPGESTLQAALRETQEETTLELDKTFVPVLCASYDQPQSRDGCINDHFGLYAVKAKSIFVKPKDEVKDCRWFEVSKLVLAGKKLLKHLRKNSSDPKRERQENVLVDGVKVNWMDVYGVYQYAMGHTKPVLFVQTRKPQPMLLY